MADKKITDLTQIATMDLGDWFPIVDKSDTTGGPAGTTKKIEKQGVFAGYALTSAEQTWSAPQRYGNNTISSGSTKTLDMNAGCLFNTSMTINSTLSIANAQSGQSGRIYITQDATGGWTLSFNASILFVGGTPPTINLDANGVTMIPFASDNAGNVTLFPSSEDLKTA